AASFAGSQSEAAFAGEGGCYLEVGGGEALMVRGFFLASPEPRVELTDSSPKFLEEKRSFETRRLQAWLT
ncbi:MAG TPA: hypothetical protein VI793_14395, partial [Anaerolineales bacterium]|nr:hypothetical protein [Anaerolineales bacterium]